MSYQYPHSHVPKIISQEQIDLESNWWMKRIRIHIFKSRKMWMKPFWGSFRSRLHGYYWSHHQILIGTIHLEFTIRLHHT